MVLSSFATTRSERWIFAGICAVAAGAVYTMFGFAAGFQEVNKMLLIMSIFVLVETIVLTTRDLRKRHRERKMIREANQAPPITPPPSYDDTQIDMDTYQVSKVELEPEPIVVRLDPVWRFGWDMLGPILIPIMLTIDKVVFGERTASPWITLVVSTFVTFFPFRKQARDTLRESARRLRRSKWIILGVTTLVMILFVYANQSKLLDVVPLIERAYDFSIWVLGQLNTVTRVTVAVWLIACAKVLALVYAWRLETVTFRRVEVQDGFGFDITQRQGVWFRSMAKAYAHQITGVQAHPVAQVLGLSMPFVLLDPSYTGNQQPIPSIEGFPRKRLADIGIGDPVD